LQGRIKGVEDDDEELTVNFMLICVMDVEAKDEAH